MTAVPAHAGPPFLTDDPEPTETGHWEIYAPFLDADGRGAEFGGAVGAEINYGAASDLQLTLGLPLAFAHDHSGWTRGLGDLEISAKYRFYHDEKSGFSIAAFPGVTLPTATNGLGPGKATAFLPIWAQKDIGDWSLFGGGGYTINAGDGSRDYWSGGAALTHTFGKNLLLGVEMDRQGPDADDSQASTSLGIGAIYQLKAPFRLLASGGPTLSDDGGPASFHMFVALGIDF
ncbi:MAG: transporter [Sphingobium sp.]|nr:transporter [Sphingobium sp.]